MNEESSKYQKIHRKEITKKQQVYQHEYYKRYSEHLKEKARQRHHENKEEINKAKRVYHHKNKMKINARQRDYYRKNKDRFKKYFKSNKFRELQYQSNLRRRSQKHQVFFSPVHRRKLLERDKWTCQNCKRKVHDKRTGNWNTPNKAHIDHIIPISKGGNSEPDNLQILCRDCNLSKGAKINKQLKLIL